MSEKVVLPKEVADAIGRLRRLGNNTRFIVSAANGDTDGENSAVLKSYVNNGENNFDNVLSAIVNGYTVEQTPEEAVREYYESEMTLLSHIGKYDGAYHEGSTEAIRETLKLLGIKIEGVNA